MRPRILVLELDSVSRLGGELRDILRSSFGPDAITPGNATSELHDVLYQLAAYPGPTIACLILPPLPQVRLHEVVRSIKDQLIGIPLLVVPEFREADVLLSLLKHGAADFLAPPLREADVVPRVLRLMGQKRPGEKLSQSMEEKIGLKQLIGESPVFLAAMRKIPIVARYDVAVFIMGETGTGKEMCARAIHHLSPRADKPFIPVNCGAIPTDLVENELFGHTKGAFTGASSVAPGLIAEANGGTLFLDEIDALPLVAQVKLLRFLQDTEYRSVGSTKLRHADVRVIAASNADVSSAIAQGKLRRDLYYRLNVVPLSLPALRERHQDIPVLVRHFLEKCAQKFDKPRKEISPNFMKTLLAHDWPGNVRELEHAIERAFVLSESPVLQSAEFILDQDKPVSRDESFQTAKSRVVAAFERSYIQSLLVAYDGNISRSAKAARKNRRAFFQLIRKHQIDVQRFKRGRAGS